jgi:hypothetical protein
MEELSCPRSPRVSEYWAGGRSPLSSAGKGGEGGREGGRTVDFLSSVLASPSLPFETPIITYIVRASIGRSQGLRGVLLS